MRCRIVARRNAERVKHWTRRNVRPIECCSRTSRERNAHATPAALHDERVALEPEPIGEPRQQRIDRREDASVCDVGARIRAQRAPVDQDGDRRARWE